MKNEITSIFEIYKIWDVLNLERNKIENFKSRKKKCVISYVTLI